VFLLKLETKRFDRANSASAGADAVCHIGARAATWPWPNSSAGWC